MKASDLLWVTEYDVDFGFPLGTRLATAAERALFGLAPLW